MSFKIGDTVRIIDREPTQADVKSGLFYNHFRNLAGTVERIYDDNTTLCIDVEVENLPQDIRERHSEIASEMRDKWLDGLSQEARSRLTEAEKRFRLRYKIVVAKSDVQPLKGGTKKPSSKPAAKPASTKASAPPKPQAKAKEETAEPKRPTLNDLEKAERKYLKAKQSKGGGRRS